MNNTLYEGVFNDTKNTLSMIVCHFEKKNWQIQALRFTTLAEHRVKAFGSDIWQAFGRVAVVTARCS